MFIDIQYAWFIWSIILLVIWGAVYFLLNTKDKKREMLIVSLWTSLAGLTEPLFVPEYWSPPSLFDLALRTGFDIESVLWAFGVGGIAVVIYERLFRTKHQQMPQSERHGSRHRFHFFAIAGAPVTLILFLALTDLNPIHAVIIALTAGGLFAWYCRPDLKKKMLASAGIFLGIYFVYFRTLVALFPGYVERVWNLGAISGVLIFGVPLEELLFALSFGFLWSSLYEHFTWQRIKNVIA